MAALLQQNMMMMQAMNGGMGGGMMMGGPPPGRGYHPAPYHMRGGGGGRAFPPAPGRGAPYGRYGRRKTARSSTIAMSLCAFNDDLDYLLDCEDNNNNAMQCNAEGKDKTGATRGRCPLLLPLQQQAPAAMQTSRELRPPVSSLKSEAMWREASSSTGGEGTAAEVAQAGRRMLEADLLPAGEGAGGFSLEDEAAGGQCRPTRPGWQDLVPMCPCRRTGNCTEKIGVKGHSHQPELPREAYKQPSSIVKLVTSGTTVYAFVYPETTCFL